MVYLANVKEIPFFIRITGGYQWRAHTIINNG